MAGEREARTPTRREYVAYGGALVGCTGASESAAGEEASSSASMETSDHD